MKKLTYIEARDKIWNAYFRDEIKPLDANFCFCGTLCDNTDEWYDYKAPFGVQHPHKDYNNYSGIEYRKMEWPMLSDICVNQYDTDYEDQLFRAMLKSIEVLKQIHRDRGDYIPEDEPLLTKRTIEKITL